MRGTGDAPPRAEAAAAAGSGAQQAPAAAPQQVPAGCQQQLGSSAQGGGAARQPGLHGASGWPSRMPRPADMTLQRSTIFYCASFPRKPGLTSQRERRAACAGALCCQPTSLCTPHPACCACPRAADALTKLRGTQQAERCLYAAIFDPRHSPGAPRSGWAQPCLGLCRWQPGTTPQCHPAPKHVCSRPCWRRLWRGALAGAAAGAARACQAPPPAAAAQAADRWAGGSAVV